MSEAPWRRRLLEQLVGKPIVTPVDVAAANAPHVDHAPSQPRDPDVLAVATPADLPLYLRLFRRTQKLDTGDRKHASSTTALGYTMELDLFTFGVKLYVRTDYPKGNVKIILEDAEGRETIATYTQEDGIDG